MKKNLKPCVYKQREHDIRCDLVLFVERTCELRYAARLRSGRIGAEARASLNRAVQLHDVDPKPGDLSMARLK